MYILQHHKGDPKPLFNIVTPAGNIIAFWQHSNAFRVANFISTRHLNSRCLAVRRAAAPGAGAVFLLGTLSGANAQYALYLRAKPKSSEPKFWADRLFNQPRQPLVGVSREEARQYADWAGLCLPSEAEWEYAFRAGTLTRFYAGDKEADLERVGWFFGNSKGKLHPVGEKGPNAFGLFDMYGDFWEWTEDDYHEDYEKAPVDGQAWVDHPWNSCRVLRGGSWNRGTRYRRSAARGCAQPAIGRTFIGIRLARSVTFGP